MLVLGAQFADSERPRLVFWHEGHGDHEPLPDGGGFHVRYVTVGGERCVVLCGDDFGEPRADCVVLATPRQDGAMWPL